MMVQLMVVVVVMVLVVVKEVGTTVFLLVKLGLRSSRGVNQSSL